MDTLLTPISSFIPVLYRICLVMGEMSLCSAHHEATQYVSMMFSDDMHRLGDIHGTLLRHFEDGIDREGNENQHTETHSVDFKLVFGQNYCPKIDNR